MGDLPTAGLASNLLLSAEANRQIAHIVLEVNRPKSEALKFGHLQMLEDLGRKGALLEVHDRLSGLNSWDKESPAPQDPHHAFMKQEYWSLVEKEKHTRVILMNQDQDYYDAVIGQVKLLKQHYEGELENQERENSALEVKHKLSESLHKEEVRVLSEETRALKEKLELQLADAVVLLKDARDLKDGLEKMIVDHDENLALAHRQAKSNEALRMKQKDLETQLKQIPVLNQQLSDHHEALNAMRKEFLAPLSDIPAQAKHRDEHIQGLNKKLGQLQKIIIQLSVNDRQQPHFNETLNAKQTILEQKQQENAAYLIEKQACSNEALNRKQKLTMEKIANHTTTIQALETALENLEITQTNNSTDQVNSHEAVKELVMRLERDQRREYSALSKTNASNLKALAKEVTMLESDLKTQTSVLAEERQRGGFANSLNEKQAKLEDELEATLAMMRRLHRQFNLLLFYLFSLIISGLICAVGFWPVCGLSYYGR